MASFGNVLGITSLSGTTIPSMFPNIEDRLRQKSIMKKIMAHSGETGILVIASVNTMKAKPVPSTPWAQTERSVIAKRNRIIWHQTFLISHSGSKFLPHWERCQGHRSSGPALGTHQGMFHWDVGPPDRSCSRWCCPQQAQMHLAVLGCCCNGTFNFKFVETDTGRNGKKSLNALQKWVVWQKKT